MNQDNSLLGFLKRKSLFNETNNKNSPLRKKSRSKSKQLKESIIKKFNDFQDIKKDTKLRQTHSQKQIGFLNNQQPYGQKISNSNVKNIDNRIYEPYQIKSHDAPQPKMKINYYDGNNGRMQNRGNNNSNNTNNQIWANIVTYATSFQSARIESMQCLQTLSLKLNTQIASLNYKIDQFYKVFVEQLTNQLHNLKANIDRVVNNIFKEAQNSIRSYIKVQQERWAQNIFTIRDKLQKEYIKVSSMREEINKPEWRKVAGQILSTNLQKNVEALLQNSKYLEIKRWETKDISGQKLRNLEMELRNLVKFKE